MDRNFFELKIRDANSLTDIVHALTINGYLIQTSVKWKEFPYQGIDYFAVRVEEPNESQSKEED